MPGRANAYCSYCLSLSPEIQRNRTGEVQPKGLGFIISIFIFFAPPLFLISCVSTVNTVLSYSSYFCILRQGKMKSSFNTLLHGWLWTFLKIKTIFREALPRRYPHYSHATTIRRTCNIIYWLFHHSRRALTLQEVIINTCFSLFCMCVLLNLSQGKQLSTEHLTCHSVWKVFYLLAPPCTDTSRLVSQSQTSKTYLKHRSVPVVWFKCNTNYSAQTVAKSITLLSLFSIPKGKVTDITYQHTKTLRRGDRL